MKIYLDGDGCPVIKITEKVAKQFKIKTIIVTDVSHLYESDYSEIIKVGSGADYADLKIVNNMISGDLVLTNDMGLAALVLSKKGFVINFNGHKIDNNNIDLLLQSRYLNKININKGRYPKGQKKRTSKQNVSFENELKKIFGGYLMEIHNLIESAGLGHVEKILRQSGEYTTLVTVDDTGERFVLKLSDKSQYDRRYREFEYLKMMAAAGINCLQPLGVNSIKGDTIAMYTYIKGEPLTNKISSYDDDKVYSLGSRAGMFLKSIHKCIKFESSSETENELNRTKILENYSNGGLHYNRKIENKLLKYVNDFDASFHHEKVFCHGDFRINNVIEMPNRDISILHFDDFFIGDPYDDFSKLLFQNRISTKFSNGIVNGYFNNNVPVDFFKYYYYYGCLCLLNSINAHELDSQTISAFEFLYNSSDFTLNVPKWYHKKRK